MERKPVTTQFAGVPQRGPAVSPEVRFLRFGIAFSVIVFLLAGAADATSDGLAILVGMLMGLCGALAVATAGFGVVALSNLWQELFLQLRRAKTSSLVAALPLALLGLASGLSAFIFAGWLLKKVPAVPSSLYKEVMWILITSAFYFLWIGRSYASVFMRLILLTLFSAIILISVVLALWWAGSLTAHGLVVCLSAIGAINALFYAVFVRDIALADNLINPSPPPPHDPSL